ncbi:MAG: stage II sporulation protein M [Anaerovoracaceae bacterium]
MKTNYRLMVVLLFALAVSICAGSFFEVSMTGQGKDELESLLGNLLQSDGDTGDCSGPALSFGRCFISLFFKNLLVLIMACIAPAVFVTLPVLPVFILLRGIAFGFSAAMTLEVAGLKGIIYIITAILPQNLIQLPVYCFLATLSLHTGIQRIRQISGRKRNAMHIDARRYFLIFSAGFGIITLSCLLEAFLTT